MRDLFGACFSPALLFTAGSHSGINISDCELLLTSERRRWLTGLDLHPTALENAIAASPHSRLGLYFEQLWQFFLANDPATELIAHNLPVRAAGATVGEFDCLYHCRERNRPVHLELAVKYYLGSDSADDITNEVRWYGPNTRDRLDLKLAHLLSRQIRLGDHPAAISLLHSYGITDPLREIALRGCLFQPWQRPLPLPPGYNTDCPTGVWVTLSELDAFTCTSDAVNYLVLDRLRWLSPARGYSNDALLTRPALGAALTAAQHGGRGAQLVAAIDHNGHETQRFFVVHDEWALDVKANHG